MGRHVVSEARIYVRLNTSCDETEYAEVFRDLKPETGECSLPSSKVGTVEDPGMAYI